MRTILIVDDNPINLHVAEEALKDSYNLVLLTSGKQALRFLKKKIPDLILLDILMPEMDGFEVVSALKADQSYENIPVIFLTAQSDSETEIKALSMGVVDFITKPFVGETMLSRIKLHLELADYRKGLETLVERKTKMIRNLQDAISISIAELVECRDGITGGHVKRTKQYLKILVDKMREEHLYEEYLTDEYEEGMMRSALLHDIGKVGINDATLLKPSSLSSDEMEYMKQHTMLGGDTLQRAIDSTNYHGFLETARDMAYYHHEKWNGKGYPKGLSETDIPLCARIMSVVDVYDALTAVRPYKKEFSHEKAVDIIQKDSGTAFEPCIVDVFVKNEESFREALEQFRQE